MRHDIEKEKTVPTKMVRSKVCAKSRMKQRRIRLSANTAIQFYDVQDRLGYDRATKAIDWLMKEAKVAIDALGDANQGVHPEYRVPATTTDPSETFHRTCYDQIQRKADHYDQTKAPLDFTWEPIQSGFGFPNGQTSNNGSLGCCFQQEVHVQEDEKDNLVVVAGDYLPTDTSALHYQH